MNPSSFPPPRPAAHAHIPAEIEGLLLLLSQPSEVRSSATGVPLYHGINSGDDAYTLLEATGVLKGAFHYMAATNDGYIALQADGPDTGWAVGRKGDDGINLYVRASTGDFFRVLHFDGELGSAEFDKAYSPKVVALTDGVNIATDASLGNVFNVVLHGNRTLDAPSNPTPGQRITYCIKQDSTGSRTLTFASGAGAFRFSTSIPSPTLTTTADALDYIEFIYEVGANRWDVADVRKGY